MSSRRHRRVHGLSILATALGTLIISSGAIAGTTTSLALTPVVLNTINALNSPSEVSSATINAWGGVTYSYGSNGLAVSFPPFLSSEGLKFLNTSGATLTGGCAVAMDVTNPTTADEYVYPGLYDTSNVGMTAPFLVRAGQTVTIALQYSSAGGSTSLGMTSLPSPLEGMEVQQLPLPSTMNTASLGYVALYPQTAATTVIVKNIRVIQNFSYQTILTGSVDKYGQTTLLPTTNEVTSDSQFATRLANEQATLSSEGALQTNVDQYGGQLSLPTQKATGHFYTTQYGGKWWFVTPLGHLMFLTGMHGVTGAGNFAPTETQNRSYLFNSLPASTDPTAAAYDANTPTAGDTSFDFYKANLIRKYGSNYLPAWQNMTYNRLKNWGFNAVGWIPAPFSLGQEMPYTMGLTTQGSMNKIYTPNSYAPIPDPYDPNFTTNLAQNAAMLRMAESDPYCVGVWVDNEIGWWSTYNDASTSVGLSVLGQSYASSPAKHELMNELERRYSSIARLNAMWHTHFASWTAMQAPVTLPWQLVGPTTRDLRYFQYILACKYFQTVRNYVKSVAPDVLYLGCKFDYWTPETMLAAKNYVDVISWDAYDFTLPQPQLNQVLATGKPVMVSEFNYRSQQSGFYESVDGHTTPTDTERASSYLSYSHNVADNSSFVGMIWYKYIDDPVTGTTDGNNYNSGFVDVTDTPYQYMVDQARAINGNIANWHLNGN